MKKREKEDKHLERALPETFGARLFSFGEQKIASIMKTVHGISRNDRFVNQFRPFGEIGLQPGHKPVRHRKTLLPLIYVHPPFSTKREKSEECTAIGSIAPNHSAFQFANGPFAVRVQSLQAGGSFPQIVEGDLVPSRMGQGVGCRGDAISKFLPTPRLSPESLPSRRRFPVHETGTMLSSEIQKLFSRWLNIRLPAVQIHQNRETDTFLRKHSADAMTVGHDIFFRTGKFDVKNARGLGLLGHELTHVAQQQPGDWRNSGVNRSTEHLERSARDNERFVLARTQSPAQQQALPSDIFSLPLAGRRGGLPSAPVSATPMFADTSRNAAPDKRPEEVHSMAVPESEMSRIKEEVYRDLMMRIKTDFERGA